MTSRFGTSSEAVIRTVQENGKELLLAIDDRGLYLTTAAYIDKAKADPNRYSAARTDTDARLRILGLDPAAVFEENKDKIRKAVDGEAKKKVNPLKASKRSMGR